VFSPRRGITNDVKRSANASKASSNDAAHPHVSSHRKGYDQPTTTLSMARDLVQDLTCIGAQFETDALNERASTLTDDDVQDEGMKE
jgi:hypothetical protein